MNDVFTIRALVSMNDETFDAFLKDLRARRKALAARAESAQKKASAAAAKLVTPPELVEERAAWARRNMW